MDEEKMGWMNFFLFLLFVHRRYSSRYIQDPCTKTCFVLWSENPQISDYILCLLKLYHTTYDTIPTRLVC